MILYELQTAQENLQIVTIFANPDDPKEALTGFVDLVTDTYVRLRGVTKFGDDDGYKVRPLADLFRLDRKTDYEKIIEFVLKEDGHRFKRDTSLPRESMDDDLRRETLRQAKERKMVVCVEIGSGRNMAFGFVDKIAKEHLQLRVLDDVGRENGVAVFRINDVVAMDCDGQYERRLQILHEGYAAANRLSVVPTEPRKK